MTLVWTSCDTVRYGSVPCDDDDCVATLEGDDDNPEKSSGSESSKESKDGKSGSSTSGSSTSSSSHRGGFHRSSSSKKESAEDVKGSSSSRTTVEKLPECTAANEGSAYTMAGVQYYCISGSWSKEIPETYDVKCSDGILDLQKIGANSAYAAEIEDNANYRRTGVSIKGVAQKGPFRHGTSLKIVELDSAMRLAESKRTHETCIVSADGSFNFAGLNLVSPYVKAEAKGYYRDELTGENSSSLLALNAVVDLSSRDSFNVNILTHLAAPRVLKLVQDAGNNQPIGSQSGRALSDVLSAFGISLGGSSSGYNGFGGRSGFGGRGQTTSSSQKSAEDLALFGSDDYNAALLAVSVMLQSYGSANEMLTFANQVATDIQGDGGWGDNSSKAKLADKVLMLDAEGGLEKIRQNLEGWNLGSVPDFEKHVRNFWTKTHNFETCGSMNAGQVKHVGNSQSQYFVSYYEQPNGPKIRFICDRTTKNWRVATDLEKDTYGLGAGDYDGQVKSGKVNQDKSYIYDQRKRSWREPQPGEIVEFEDVGSVLKKVAAGEKVIFILRHAERTDDTGKNGHLTDKGKKQSQSVGEKFKGEDIYFANSTYLRSYETCSNVATGAGFSALVSDTIPQLDGDWFVKDDSKFENYKNNNGGGWVVTSEYAYKGSYPDAYYPLQTRGEEFITEVVKPRFEKVNKMAVWISHDMLVVPLVAFCTEGKANLRYFDTKQWINYLAGMAIIMGADGTLRYVPVKGLDSGTMTM